MKTKPPTCPAPLESSQGSSAGAVGFSFELIDDNVSLGMALMFKSPVPYTSHRFIYAEIIVTIPGSSVGPGQDGTPLSGG